MQKTILIGHGSGGLMTEELIRNVFVKHLGNPILDILSDSAILRVEGRNIAFTTDSFVVDPVFFPGGDIGKLAVCGTVNDLSVSGAKPLFLSSAFILEEGFPLSDLDTIVRSMAAEAIVADIQIVTGDTKVVRKGQCDKIFINTAGIGIIDDKHIGIAKGTGIEPGDKILVNGFLGDHEMAILATRQNLEFEPPVISDVASLCKLTSILLKKIPEIHFMRDITRGGLATVLSEIAVSRNTGIFIDESEIPVREQVNGICEIFGFNPLYLANEGKLLLIVPADLSELALDTLKEHPLGTDARIIGEIQSKYPGKVLMKSVIGGTRMLEKLAGEQLPRIC
jgi:hydrogenase expression/formation protein HypE